MRYDHTSNFLKFNVNGSERFRISSNGNVTIDDGNLIVGTSGHGIDFSATSDGSGATSEILYDYEVGTFTPTTNEGSFTSAEGKYTKIGNQVTVWIYIPTISNTTSTSNFQVESLPFSGAAGMVQSTGSVMVRYVNSTSIDGANFSTYQDGGWSYLRIYTSRDDGNNYEAVKHSDFSQTSPGLRICHTYQSA